MDIDKAMEAAERMCDPDDGGVEEFMECGLDVVEALRAEVTRLREIIAGRTTAPSAAESEAHAAAGGSWRVVVGGKAVPWAASEPVSWSGIDGGAVRRIMRDYSDGDPWCWALDADGRPCAWPVAP